MISRRVLLGTWAECSGMVDGEGRGTVSQIATHPPQRPGTNRESSESPLSSRSVLNPFSANFWLEFLFWWTEHAPRVVWWTRGLFLYGAWRLGASMRRNTMANARCVVGDSADEATCAALAKRMIRSFYLAVYELGAALRVPKHELKDHIDSVEGGDIYHEARRGKHGAVVVTAHLGCFELGMAALVEHETRVHVVFRRDASPRFDRLRSKLREKLGVWEAPVDDGWSTWSRLRDALANDEVVMIQGDRVMPGQKGVAVPFLSGRLLVPTGPLKLALIAGAPVVPVFSLRTAVGRLRIVVEEPITLTRDDGPIDARHPAVRRLAAVIEKHVRGNPDQWLMVEPLWFEQEGDDPKAASNAH